MTAFAEYLLKVIICSGVLTGYYWLALRNKLFHSWNRYYLLAAVTISLLLPFVKISFITEPQPENLPAYTILQTVTTNEVWFPEHTSATAKTFTKEQASIILYVLVSIALFITLLVTLLRIKKLITAYEHWKMKDLTFVDTDAKGTPFSFMRYIFWNREIDFESAQGQQIFKHELIHVKEKHSLDKLFLQLVLIVFWINPFFWIIRKELTMIHEFIADRKSVKDSDASALAAMILTAAFPGHTLSLTNPFFYSPIKRRLLMLSKLQNPKVGYISRLLLLPLLTLLFTAFAVKIKENDRPSSIPRLEKQLTVVIDAGHGFIDGKRHGSLGINGISEDEIALAISKKIEQLNTDKNLKLIFTRTNENYIDAKERVKITEENNADLFISIHANYAPPVKTENGTKENPLNGFELYVSNDNNPFLQMSKELGSAIIQEVKSFIPIRKESIKQRKVGIWVIEALTCPAVLLECGFISNSNEAAFLTNEKNQERIAEAVLKGIVNYAFAEQQKSSTTSIQPTIITKDTLPKSKNDDKITFMSDTVTLQPSKEKQLIIVNGKRINPNSNSKFIFVTPAKITVIETGNKAAIEKYGPEAKNGVAIIEGGTIIEQKSEDTVTIPEDTPIFTKAEIMPMFPEGVGKLSSYLDKTLTDKKQTIVTDQDIHRLEIEIIIDKSGKVARVIVLKGAKDQAANIFKDALINSPAWSPAIQNGHNVFASKKISINYKFEDNSDEHFFSLQTN